MGLFNWSKNKKESMKQVEELDKLTPEGKLPWGWHYKNKDFTEKMQSEYSYFLNNWIDSKNVAPMKQYSTLKSLVIYLKDAHKLCHSKDECFALWFDDIIASTEYIKERETELKELETNLEQLQKKYESRQSALVGLEEKVLHTLKDNDGILQSDFVKLFDETVKEEVKTLLYYWHKDGKIERIKSGRSYILRIK